MTDRLARVEEQLHELDEAFDALRARVARLEGDARGTPAVDVPAATTTSGVEFSVKALPILTLVGRTFLVFGGAYLLRALTDTGRLPPSGGVVLGLTYASAWIGAADRAAVLRPASGLFHGFTSLLIACPLLLEASTRFGVLSPASAASLLVGFTAIAISVAWHRDLQALAGMATVAASLTALALALTTGHVLPFAAAALVNGATAELYGAHRGWRWPARPAILTANLLLLDVVIRAHGTASIEPVGAALATCLLLTVVHVVVLTASAILRPASIFDISQSLAAVVIGLGGAFALARLIGPIALDSLGIALLAMGIAGYLFAVPQAARWPDRASAVLTSLAAIVLIAGGAACLAGGVRDVVFGIASLTLLTLGLWTERSWLARQGVLFAIVVAITSGMLAFSADVWIGSLPTASTPLSALGATAILLVGGVILPVLVANRSRGPTAPALVLTALAAFGVGALGVLLLSAWDGRTATSGVTAAERSVVLSLLAIALTALSRFHPVLRFKWLSYATIALCAIKLAAEDMRVSSPIAIFVALGAYGAALIVTAKLLGRSRA